MSEVHDREREARGRLTEMMQRLHLTGIPPTSYLPLLDVYRDAVEARVRWDQQAQAEANG